MKYNFKNISKLMLACLVFGSAMSSCTKNFEEYNKNNNGLTDEDLTADGKDLVLFFKTAQMGIYNFSGGKDPNSFQVQQNINADVYSGYLMSPNDFGGRNNMNYGLMDNHNGEAFKVLYLSVIKSIDKLQKNGLDKNYPALGGAAKVIKVVAANRVTDIYGPIPYTKVGSSDEIIPYDKQSDIYSAFFKELDEAVEVLKAFNAQSPMTDKIEEIDLVYPNMDNQTRFKNWLKLANSLRLRLAVRIVKVDPQLAKTQAEKALNPANGGVIEANSENFKVKVPTDGVFSNPLWFISKNWADTRINATLSSYMVGLKDPRISKYMLPVTNDPALAEFKGQYIGIRAGGNTIEKNNYQKLSSLNTDGSTPSFTATTAPVLMTAAEVYFLRAEGALRGWANVGGTAKSLYEKGIETSFAQWGVSGLSAYLQDNTSKAAAYVDPFNASNNADAPTNLTIQWNDAASNEEKLERIITQKWLAIFPEGQEAWSEFRRTGYPKLFPVAVNNSAGLIDTKIQIRRLPFPQNEYNTNAAEVQNAISLLGGADNGGTRLWWDVNKGNF